MTVCSAQSTRGQSTTASGNKKLTLSSPPFVPKPPVRPPTATLLCLQCLTVCVSVKDRALVIQHNEQWGGGERCAYFVRSSSTPLVRRGRVGVHETDDGRMKGGSLLMLLSGKQLRLDKLGAIASHLTTEKIGLVVQLVATMSPISGMSHLQYLDGR